VERLSQPLTDLDAVELSAREIDELTATAALEVDGLQLAQPRTLLQKKGCVRQRSSPAALLEWRLQNNAPQIICMLEIICMLQRRPLCQI
jgi:hypothetical protein